MAVPSWLFVALPLLVGIVLWSIAAFVFRSGRDRAYNLAFAALYGLSGTKSISEGIAQVSGGFHARAPAFPGPEVWTWINISCAAFMVPALLLFVCTFPRPADFLVRRPRLATLFAVPSILWLFALASGSADLGPQALLAILNAGGVLATAAATVLLFRARANSRDPIDRTRASYVLLGFVPAFVGTWVLTGHFWLRSAGVVDASWDAAAFAATWLVVPPLELAAAAVTGYAIVKYQLVGIELQAKAAVRFVVTTVTLFGGIFIVHEWVNARIIGPIFAFTDLDWLFTGVAGALLFRPLEHGATWVANHVFPDTMGSAEAYARKRAAEVYHAQASYVLRDAKVTDRELDFLRRLRIELKLSDTEARRIEEEVERIEHVDVARLGASAAPKQRRPRPPSGSGKRRVTRNA